MRGFVPVPRPKRSLGTTSVVWRILSFQWTSPLFHYLSVTCPHGLFVLWTTIQETLSDDRRVGECRNLLITSCPTFTSNSSLWRRLLTMVWFVPMRFISTMFYLLSLVSESPISILEMGLSPTWTAPRSSVKGLGSRNFSSVTPLVLEKETFKLGTVSLKSTLMTQTFFSCHESLRA